MFRNALLASSLDYAVSLSFVQLYNESLFDLLRDPSLKHPLSLRELASGEVYVQGLSEFAVRGVREAMQLLTVAEENRVTRATAMNLLSSRSHSVFQITVHQRRLADDGGEVTLRSKLRLVDLAGSEKWNMEQALVEQHVTELASINLR